MSTPHNSAEKGQFAKCVLMPGDPLRAKFVAEHFLEDIKLVNQVRNMLAYTGTYQGRPVSVMASGMGAPSMGIYSRELFDQYGVDTILRIGTTGSLQDHIHVGDLILAAGACTDTNFLAHWKVTGFAPIAAPKLVSRAMALAEVLNVFPVFIRRINLTKCVSLAILGMALGKGVGALLFFWNQWGG